MSETPLQPELQKRSGVYYALTDDGIELPILDVTHPGFSPAMTEAEQRESLERYEREQRSFERIPRPLRRLILRLALRGSVLGRGLLQVEGSFLDGMSTYLIKLGPELLGAAYSKPIDRRIAASLPAHAIRRRFADVARLLADALLPLLAERPDQPVDLLNIAGGPAVDSINALLLLQREHGELIERRSVLIHVLDADPAGPHFGQRALRALQVPSAPLHGLRIELVHRSYDWRDTSGLAPALEQVRARSSVCVASSEGGLFEYGSDREIMAHLEYLRTRTPPGFAFVGSVTRGDELARRMVERSRAALHPRGLTVFGSLVGEAGFHVARSMAGLMSDQVLLTKSLVSDEPERPASARG